MPTKGNESGLLPSAIKTESDRRYVQQTLEAKIAQLQQVELELSSIFERQRSIQVHIDNCRTLLSPMYRLPPDILAEIFVRCLPADHNAITSTKEAPLILGFVCRTWRNISLSTPCLWASIHITVPASHITVPSPTCLGDLHLNEAPLTSSRRKDGVSAWLTRSGFHPLSISLAENRSHFCSQNNSSRACAATDMMLMLILLANRWQNIELAIPRHALSILLALSERDVPLLKSLSIRSSVDYSSNEISTSVFSAPRLQTLRLAGMPDDILAYNVNWSSLTELHLRNHGYGYEDHRNPKLCPLNPQSTLELLSRCSNLVHCSLHLNDSPARQLDLMPSVVSMLHLTELLIFDTRYPVLDSLGPFFERLDTPLLTTFKYASIHGDGRDGFSPSTLLIRVPMLETVCIGNLTNMSSMQLEQCLRSIPLVSRLILGTLGGQVPLTALDDDILKLLTAFTSSRDEAPATAYLCPRLKFFEGRGRTSFSDETLFNFIKSRTDIGLPLKQVEVTFDHAPTVDLEARLHSEIAAGLELILHYPSEVSVSARAGLQWNDHPWF